MEEERNSGVPLPLQKIIYLKMTSIFCIKTVIWISHEQMKHRKILLSQEGSRGIK